MLLTATATDGDGDTLRWSLGGEDAALFAIDAATGALSFVAAPDFETPLDVGADNSYRVTLIASDGTLSDSRAIVIRVTNVAEIIGTNGPDRLVGTAAAELLLGLGGNDILNGRVGAGHRARRRCSRHSEHRTGHRACLNRGQRCRVGRVPHITLP